MTEEEYTDKVAYLKDEMERLATETRKANEAWHRLKKELDWVEAAWGGEEPDVED